MTLPFDAKKLKPAAPALFVLVHPNRRGRRFALADGEAAGILRHCRAALAHARKINMAVAFVATWPRNLRIELYWIKGLEPGGRDMVFRHVSSSCYASRYFSEAVENYRTLVIAGFLNAACCVATVMDAMRAGHDIICLRDAIAGSTGDGAAMAGLRNLSNGRVSIRDTATWMETTGSAAELPAVRPVQSPRGIL